MKCDEDTKIIIYSGVVDLRKGSVGLRNLVGSTELKTLYLFSNRSRNLLKYLQVDKFGISTGARRLSSGLFQWPESPLGSQCINSLELEYLLNGNSIKKLRLKTLLS